MTTVLFVHGTGARGQTAEFNTTPEGQQELTHYGTIKETLSGRQPGIEVASCAWGEAAGYRLADHGISIPTYAATGGVLGLDDAAAPAMATTDAALWGLLLSDRLAELRLLRAQAADQGSTAGSQAGGSVLDARVQSLAFTTLPADLQDKLTAAGLNSTFDAAAGTIRANSAYHDALAHMQDGGADGYRAAIARAIVAEAAVEREAQGTQPPLLFNADLRDVVTNRLADELATGGGVLGIFSPFQQAGVQVFAQLLTDQIKQRRGALMTKVLGFIGDILVYQAHGPDIRAQIRASVEQATPPVVVLGHSLGGIACVDLLIEQDLHDRVPLLITCGSQAPVFYEMGALQLLRYSPTAELPAYFPPWLNIYDLQDMLSFVGAGLFPGRIKDVQVDNRQPFPYSHSAYWNNAAVWDAIMTAIGNPASVVAPS